MEWKYTKEYIKHFVALFASVFGLGVALTTTLGSDMVDYYCSASSPPFWGGNFAGGPFCSIEVAFILILVMTIGLMIVILLGAILLDSLKRVLMWLGDYYQNWYYFPKLEISGVITPRNEIELQVINRRRWQRLSLRLEFYYAEPRNSPSNIRGVAPASIKELLALDTIPGGAIRTKIIGRVIEGGMIFSTGNKNQEVQFTEPGIYDYAVNMSGEFRGKKFGAHATVPFRITNSHEVKVEE